MSERPNILWLMTDEQRTDSLGCYGSSWARSPHLDRLAGEGCLFETAVTPAPVCVPARVSILTGLPPSRTGIWWNQTKHGKTLSHLTNVFAEAGYRTASFGKHHYYSPNKAFQTEVQLILSKAVGFFRYGEPYDGADYGMVRYPPKPWAWIFGGTFPEPAERTTEAQAVRKAIEWLQQHPADQPFLLRVSLNAPHTPVAVPEPFDCLIDPEAIHLPAGAEAPAENEPKWISESLRPQADSARLTAEEIRQMRRYYCGQVAFVDDQLGRLLEWMRGRELLDNTIVAFVSDHGTHLGDYGLVQKQTFYEPVVNVPYFFWWPRGIKQGVRIRQPVETRGLLPTLLDLAGLPCPQQAADASLAAVLTGRRAAPDAPVFSEFTLGSFGLRHDERLVMVRDGSWKLTLCLDPIPHDGGLYDLQEDPFERRNVFGRAEHAKVREHLTGLVLRHVAR